ncbi:hypothetical protein [Phenylobacterium sp.]|uniref:hypothetical protein n=1 Tax=Phenylobacterium sp. TaxID=1871053 RepID=UPI0012175475|nr:hypothetical protein [Phenylobacterium sp.]THD63025.1 MAG: hypothetical protein E8A49_06675 [Phenylobacterium sp.]
MRLKFETAGLRSALLGVVALGGFVAAPWAQAAVDPQDGKAASGAAVIADRPATVDELEVVAHPPCLPPKVVEKGGGYPKVVSTYPRQDQAVRQGLLIMRVTFDRPMSCSGSFTAEGQNPCPSEAQNFLMSLDRRTIRVACFVEPGKHFTFWLNPVTGQTSPPLPLFMSLQGRAVAAYRMTFTTSREPPIQTIPEALSADPETVLADVYRPEPKAEADDPRP